MMQDAVNTRHGRFGDNFFPLLHGHTSSSLAESFGGRYVDRRSIVYKIAGPRLKSKGIRRLLKKKLRISPSLSGFVLLHENHFPDIDIRFRR